MTNLERIRTLSEIELVRLIRGLRFCPEGDNDCPAHDTCNDCWLAWLHEEAEVE